MFRYVLPIILAGGKSYRFGIDKKIFLNNKIFFFYNLGFISVLISGYINGYSFLLDFYINYGPLSAYYATYFFNNYCFYTHYLFLPLDILFFDKKLILIKIILSKSFFSYSFFSYGFPFLLSNSYNSFIILLNFCMLLNQHRMSFNFFLKFILLCNFNTFFLKKENFINLNNYYSIYFIK